MDKNCTETLSKMPQINSKMRENALAAGWGGAPDPAGGAHNAPPDPLANFWGSTPDPAGEANGAPPVPLAGTPRNFAFLPEPRMLE